MQKGEFYDAAITPIEERWRDFVIQSQPSFSITQHYRIGRVENALTEKIVNLYGELPIQQDYRLIFQSLLFEVAVHRLDCVLENCGKTTIGSFSKTWIGGVLMLELCGHLLGFPTGVRSEIASLSQRGRFEAIRGFLIGVLCLSWTNSEILENVRRDR